jgi:transposase
MRIARLFGIATSVIDGGSSLRRVWSGDHHQPGATFAATPRQRDLPLPRNEWVAGQVSSRQPAVIDPEAFNLIYLTASSSDGDGSNRHEIAVARCAARKTRAGHSTAQRGGTYDEIAAQPGLSRTGVFDICKRHGAAGAKALRDSPSGRKSGDGRLLDATQEAAVRKLITDKTPDQVKMPYALLARGAVAQLIEQRFGIRLPVRTMGLYLARWGFTPQKPMKKAYEQSPGAVKKWLDEDYPVIAARA